MISHVTLLEPWSFIQGSSIGKIFFPQFRVPTGQGEFGMLRHKQEVFSWRVADDEEPWLQFPAQLPLCQTADVVHRPRTQHRGVHDRRRNGRHLAGVSRAKERVCLLRSFAGGAGIAGSVKPCVLIALPLLRSRANDANRQDNVNVGDW